MRSNATTTDTASLAPEAGVSAPLADCVVLEFGVGASGQYAGRQLAALGARVVKFEALSGDPMRAQPRFVHDQAGKRYSLPFEYLNEGKEGIAVDFDDDFAFELLRGFAPRDLALLIPPELAARVPDDFRGAVIVSGPHGASGSRVNVPSTPFTRYQEGGDGYVLPGGDGPFRPTSPPDLTAECFIGNGIVVAILSTLLITRRDGRFEDTPARVDFSQQAHLVNLQKMFVGRCSVEGIDLTRANHCYPFGGATRCKDGYVSMLLNEEHQWHGLTHIIGRPEWAHDPRFAGGAGRRAMRVEVSAALNAWCSQHTVDEFLALTSQYGVPVGRIRTPAEVLNNPVLRKRGFLSDVETPYGAGVHVGLPYGPIDPLWRAVPYRRAPRLGEHSHAILAGLGHSEADIALYENLALVRRDMA